jgi:hypothetical protein
VFDLARDARTFDLSCPVVAHPPCRAWGKLAHFAKARADERDLALFASWAVRHCGGVLEHPITSKLWAWLGVRPGVRDEFGGLLVPVKQSSFGHRAEKLTGLYYVRCAPIFSLALDVPAVTTVERMCRAERERTPLELAQALVASARAVA